MDLTNVSLGRTILCDIMEKHGSDKSSKRHNYTPIYHHVFSGRRYDVKSVLEIGIGSANPNIPFNMVMFGGNVGASLYGWKEYFPNAEIHGADIDDKTLFTADKISCFWCNQLSNTGFSCIPDMKYDIIIDDGYHSFDANFNTLFQLYNRVKKGGVYVIEDVVASVIGRWNDISSAVSKTLGCRLCTVHLPNPHNAHDNNLVMLQF